MSVSNTSQSGDDSSGNLAAAADTTPDLTIDQQKPVRRDPNDTNDTFQDPLAPQNAWPDPLAEDAVPNKVWSDPLAEETQRDLVQKKQFADPLAQGETDGDPQATQKDWKDPLATANDPDKTAQDANSVKPAASQQTDWEPVDKSKSKSAGSAPPAKPKPGGRRIAEGDLFANKYEIKGHIGQGGMGIVYKATDVILGRLVAIKFL